MAEKRIEVRTIMVRLMCDKCGEGEMKPTGVALMSHPPQYPHKCDKCGAETTIRGGKTYPSMEYEEVTPNSSAQPAPSVPEDVMRDAERYRYLRARDDEARESVFEIMGLIKSAQENKL